MIHKSHSKPIMQKCQIKGFRCAFHSAREISVLCIECLAKLLSSFSKLFLASSFSCANVICKASILKKALPWNISSLYSDHWHEFPHYKGKRITWIFGAKKRKCGIAIVYLSFDYFLKQFFISTILQNNPETKPFFFLGSTLSRMPCTLGISVCLFDWSELMSALWKKMLLLLCSASPRLLLHY